MFLNLVAVLSTSIQYLFFLGPLEGDFLCHAMYYAAIVMYKPLTLNMLWLLTVTITYAFTHIFNDKSPHKHHQRNGLGTPSMAPVPRNRFTIAMMFLVSMAFMAYLVIALVMSVPILIVFLPVLIIPALIVPLVAMHYVPMLVARVVKGFEFVLCIKPASATTTSDLALKEKEKGRFHETSLALKAYVSLPICLMSVALARVRYYSPEDARTWLDHAKELLSAFTVEEFAIRLWVNFAWPDFRLAEIQMTFNLTFGVVCLTLVASYLMQALLWCASEPWFAMPSAKPGTFEERLMVAFASVRLVRRRISTNVVRDSGRI